MIKKLYLDDVRKLPDNSYTLVKSYVDAVLFIKEHGIPSFISFDHDLGIDENKKLLPNGFDFAKWLVEMDIDNIYRFPENFTFSVHSQNPVGKKILSDI